MSELFEDATGGASIEGPYRYMLWRYVSDRPQRCLFVMLNPSTADAKEDDPTIRRCKSFARDWSCGILTVVNLYAWRATDPKELARAEAMGEDLIGPKNDDVILEEARKADVIVAAWGNYGPIGRSETVYLLLRQGGGFLKPIWCLGVTSMGSPRHPLYVPSTAIRLPWRPGASREDWTL